MGKVFSLAVPTHAVENDDGIPAVNEAHLAVAKLLWKDLDEEEFRVIDTAKIAKELQYPKGKVELIMGQSLFVKRIVDRKIIPSTEKGAAKYGYRKERNKVRLLIGNSHQVKKIIDLNEIELKE